MPSARRIPRKTGPREEVTAEELCAHCTNGVPTVEFEDGTKQTLYHSFLIEGKEELNDLDFLLRNDFKEMESAEPVRFIIDKLRMFTQNKETKIRSNYDGVINVRHKCVGIQAIN